MTTHTRRSDKFAYLSAAILLLVAASGIAAQASAEPRAHATWQGQGSPRSSEQVKTLEEFEALAVKGGRSHSTRGTVQQASPSSKPHPSGQELSRVDVEFWIYDARVELFSDLDLDGYYAGVDLSFDADTVYNSADVYAVLYLSYEFGPWNEYAVTDDFTILGTSGDDEYFIETELVSGYATGDYDILIELFDAYEGTFIASFGPEDSADLAFLPLEDVSRDTPPRTTLIISEGGGGSLGVLALLVMAGFARVGASFTRQTSREGVRL